MTARFLFSRCLFQFISHPDWRSEIYLKCYDPEAMSDLAAWQWLLGVLSALMIGVAKTGLPGGGMLAAPLMVLAVGNARYAAAWTAPILCTGDVFAVVY